MAAPSGPDRRISRRAALARLAVAGISVGPASALVTGCGRDREGSGRPGRDSDTPGWMDGGMMDGGMMDREMMGDMRVIQELLLGHEEIRREVEDIERGIRSRTTSDDPQLAEQLRAHVRRMSSRVEQDQPIRQMDPLFGEIFEHHDVISMEITDLPDGVAVTETSPDPQVQLLIRQHAHRAVSEFVASGMPRAMEPTPLPEGYRG